LLLRDRESGSNRSNKRGIDAEKKRTEDGTLGNTRGNLRCRGVITNGDGLRATSKIRFDPIVDLAIKTETNLQSAEKDGVINAVKSSTEKIGRNAKSI
jgi:hypothetical protein